MKVFSRAAVQVRRFMHIHFSKTYLRKHHIFVLCKYDSAIKLEDFIKDQDLTWLYVPPGRKPGCNNELIRTTAVVKDIAAAALALIRLIHDLGYSLDGLLRLKMLYWIPHSKTLKIGGLKRGDIKSKTDEMAARDYRSVCPIFTDEIFTTVAVPRELEEWLYYLQRDPIFYKDLLPEHMYLLDDKAKVGQFIVLHQQLLQVKTMDMTIHQKALSFVCVGNCDGEFQWPAEVIQTELLEEIKDFRDPQGNLVDYGSNEGGLVKFGRHSCAHLLQDSVERIQGQHGGSHFILKIRASEIYSLLDCFVPGLFEQLQKGIFIISGDLAAANLPEL